MIKYKIIDNKGMIKAFLYDTELDLFNKIQKDFENILEGYHFRNLKKSYFATSKVNPIDEWDTDFGKRIAKDRLLIKYYDDRVKTGIQILEFYEKFLVKLYEIVKKDFNKRADYIRDLEELGIEE